MGTRTPDLYRANLQRLGFTTTYNAQRTTGWAYRQWQYLRLLLLTGLYLFLLPYVNKWRG